MRLLQRRRERRENLQPKRARSVPKNAGQSGRYNGKFTCNGSSLVVESVPHSQEWLCHGNLETLRTLGSG
jgi:hypothetical protein